MCAVRAVHRTDRSVPRFEMPEEFLLLLPDCYHLMALRSVFFSFSFRILKSGPVQTPLTPPARGGVKLGFLASSIWDPKSQNWHMLGSKMPQSVFETNWLLSTLHTRGGPYERSGGKTGGSWQLRDRGAWTVSHTQFDKRLNEPLRLRYVHRGYSCRCIIAAAQ